MKEHVILRFNIRLPIVLRLTPDTAVLYYQFIGSQFSIPITNMNVTVALPQNDTVTEKPYAWLHCTADSFLTVDSQIKYHLLHKIFPHKP